VRVMRRPLQLTLLTLSVACGEEASQQGAALTSETEASRTLEGDSRAPDSGESALIPPPRRRPILGVFGFTARSKIRFEAMPDSPHQLSATYAFPDRARWYIEPANAERGQRSVRYRSGPQAWELPPGSSEAMQYQGVQATQVLLQLELRRAAMLWPHGVDWSDGADGALRRAELATGGHLSASGSTGDLPPTSFLSHLPDGSPFEELRDLEWTDGPFGPRPASWRLVSGGAVVWSESIEGLDTEVRFVDSHFLPPHLRALPSVGAADPILLVEVPARLRQRRALTAKTWEAALEEAGELIASIVPASSTASVDPNPVFELGPDGLPKSLLIRLISREESPPEGWELAHGESALSRLSPKGEMPTKASIQELMDAMPEGTSSGRARLRVTLSGGNVETSQLLLPLSPSALGD